MEYRPCNEWINKDLDEVIHWTRRAADLGDPDGQYKLALFHENAIGVERDMEQAAFWYRQAALQDHDLAIDKCKELGISVDDEITDREGLRKVLKCRVFPLNYLPSYKYTVRQMALYGNTRKKPGLISR